MLQVALRHGAVVLTPNSQHTNRALVAPTPCRTTESRCTPRRSSMSGRIYSLLERSFLLCPQTLLWLSERWLSESWTQGGLSTAASGQHDGRGDRVHWHSKLAAPAVAPIGHQGASRRRRGSPRVARPVSKFEFNGHFNGHVL